MEKGREGVEGGGDGERQIGTSVNIVSAFKTTKIERRSIE